MTQFENIAGIGLHHFENQLKVFEKKYGKIDDEMTKNIINMLNELKSIHLIEIENVDKILKELKDGKQFEQITGKDIKYFKLRINQLRSSPPPMIHTSNINTIVHEPVSEINSIKSEGNNSRKRYRESSSENNHSLKRRKLHEVLGFND